MMKAHKRQFYSLATRLVTEYDLVVAENDRLRMVGHQDGEVNLRRRRHVDLTVDTGRDPSRPRDAFPNERVASKDKALRYSSKATSGTDLSEEGPAEGEEVVPRERTGGATPPESPRRAVNFISLGDTSANVLEWGGSSGSDACLAKRPYAAGESGCARSDGDSPVSTGSPSQGANAPGSLDGDRIGAVISLDFEETLELLPAWAKATKRDNLKRNPTGNTSGTSPRRHSTMSNILGGTSDSLIGAVRAGDALRDKGLLQKCVLNPNRAACISWEVLTAGVMIYDLFMIPFRAFELPDLVFLQVASMATTVIWTIDILVTFFKGYEDQGVIEMRPKRIAIKYMKSWLVLDASIVLADWALVLLTLNFIPARTLRSIRIVRILRLLRLARLAKQTSRLMQLKEIISTEIDSDNILAIMSIFGLLIFLWMINHFIACGWYLIGTTDSVRPDGEEAWVEVFIQDQRPGWAYAYLTSLHWSLTQFTPASMEIYPRNYPERLYNIVIIFFGLIMFSTFISSMTNTMTYLRQLTFERRKQEQDLKRYMSENGVSLELGNGITSFLKSNAQKARQRLHMTEIDAFKTLPPNLSVRLRCEVYAPVITSHSLLLKYSETDEITFNNICNLAMSEKSMSRGKELFRLGGKGSAMYFVNFGSLNYELGYQKGEPTSVEQGRWVSEAVLWVRWEHRGRMTASSTVCELMELNAAEFGTIMNASDIKNQTRKYARSFAEHAASIGSANITDLWGEQDVIKEMTKAAFARPELSENDVEQVGKLVMIWGNGNADSITLERWVFLAWKHCLPRYLNRKAGRRGSVLSLLLQPGGLGQLFRRLFRRQRE